MEGTLSLKRGESGVSCVVGIDKPAGMTSHDVVNETRRIFGEKRVGHAGTLDPLASGVLLVCVGAATRLTNYFVGHNKSYLADIAFGTETDTDDAQGSVIKRAQVPSSVYDSEFASSFIQTLTGKFMQEPPRYCALKKNGKKACDQARKGEAFTLESRAVEIYSARLISILQPDTECNYIRWRVEFFVSKGTYIRSIARDVGRALNSAAHISSLRRTQLGCLDISQCVTLDQLNKQKKVCALDPVALLGYRVMFANDEMYERVKNGNALAQTSAELFEVQASLSEHSCYDCCIPTCTISTSTPCDNELMSVVYQNKLVAIYKFKQQKHAYLAQCVFQTPSLRS